MQTVQIRNTKNVFEMKQEQKENLRESKACLLCQGSFLIWRWIPEMESNQI